MRNLLLLLILVLSACDQTSQQQALGTLERERIALTATVSEVVIALPVSQGSTVKEGEVLVRLDSTWQQTQQKKAAAEVMRAEAKLDKLRNGARLEEVAAARAEVIGAKASLQVNQAEFQRTSNLVEQHLESQATLDRALANRDAASARLQSASEFLLKLTNGTRVEDLHAGEAELTAAKAVLASESKKLADLTITATRNGRLDSLPWNLGERVTVGSPLAIILSGTAPYARVYVPEPYRIKIKVGDTLMVTVDGLEQAIAGTVRWIASEPAFTPYYALSQQERSRLMYLAEVQLPDSASELPSGVPAQVSLP